VKYSYFNELHRHNDNVRRKARREASMKVLAASVKVFAVSAFVIGAFLLAAFLEQVSR
jgi:hypothetical protein